MSNLSALNLAVSGTCGITGAVSLSQPLISGSNSSFQGISTTTLTTTGAVLHNTLPVCNVLPSIANQLITKGYSDSQDSAQGVLITALQGRATAIETVNTTQNTNITALQARATAIETVDVTQNTDITALQTRATAIEGVNTTQGTQITGLQTRATAIETVNTTQTTNITALQTRATAIEGVNTAQGTSITTLQTRATTIEGVNTAQGTSIVNLETRATAIEGVNTTQGTNITALQQKTTPIVYVTPQPVAGAMTQLTSSLDLLPYTSATILKAFTLSCTALLCTVQATFGGVGANRGITTSQLQVGGFGNAFQTVYVGSVTSVVGTSNLVTFATPLTGNFPKIFLQAISGTVTLTSKTLAGFVFSATSVVNVDYWVVQLV